MTSPHNPQGGNNNPQNSDSWDESKDFDTSQHYTSQDENPTEVMEVVDVHQNKPPLPENDLIEGEYDFNFARSLEEGLRYHDWDELEIFKISTDGYWIQKPYYQELYEDYAAMGNTANDKMISMSKRMRELDQRNKSLSGNIEDLNRKLTDSMRAENAAQNSAKAEQADLAERQERFERQERNAKNLKRGLIAATAVFAILSILLAFLWFNEKSHSSSVDQRGQVNQERIDELEKSLKSANDNNSNLKAENDKLQGSNSNLNNRVNDAEGNADKLNKTIQDKDKEIQSLNDKVGELENSEPETVTSTVTGAPSTVTESNQSGSTVTSTVTQTASPSTE